MANKDKATARGNRRKGRERAFQVLYGLTFTAGTMTRSLEQAFDEYMVTAAGADMTEATAQQAQFAWEPDADAQWRLVQGTPDGDIDLDAVLARLLQNAKVEPARLELVVNRAPLDKGGVREVRQETVDFAWRLVSGVWDMKNELDKVVVRFSQNWKIERIARVELTILRLGLYEMLHSPDIPLKVAINEAVELAKNYGDENSRNFINGILDAAARAVDAGEFGTGKGF